MKLSLRTIKSSIQRQEFSVPGVGTVVLQEKGIEELRALRAFYLKNYKTEHALGNERLFKWIFENNDQKVVVLTHHGEIIAHHGIIPVVLTNGKEDYSGFISANVIVNERYRRKGLMSKMFSIVHQRYDIGANLGASMEGATFYRHLGYKCFESLGRMVAIVSPDKCARVSKNCTKLQKTIHEPSQHDHVDIRAIEDYWKIEEDIEKLWNRCFVPETYFAVRRSAEFLEWRYGRHPYFSYRQYGLWEHGILQALVVYRVENIPDSEVSVIRITDLFGDDTAIITLVNETACNREKHDRVAWVDWSSPYAKIKNTLRSAGFVSYESLLPCQIPLLCNPIDYQKTAYALFFKTDNTALYRLLPDFSGWYITKGDGDADRPNRLTWR